MANSVRSAKSGSDWSIAELLAYNIKISPVHPNEFFPHGADPSLDHLDPAILAAREDQDLNSDIAKSAADYLRYLRLAVRPSQETMIDHFAFETLKLLGYDDPDNTLIIKRYIMPLTICGDGSKVAQTDVCLFSYSRLVLLVVMEDKTVFNESGPEPSLVATAIAVFQSNNAKREANALPRLDAMTIPCITMAGTRPTFYLVPVTQELSQAVACGEYPPNQTRVLKCVTIGSQPRALIEGMENLAYRKLALQRFLAFKALARSHWEPFIDGFL